MTETAHTPGYRVTEDGGPAFPMPDQYTPQGDPAWQGSSGMTLRDWFAGQALAIVHKRFENDADPDLESIAMQAYFIADAMLEERAFLEKEADQ